MSLIEKFEASNYENPYNGINFTERKAVIKNKEGEIIFDENVEFPDFCSDDCVKIVTSKYLCNEAKRKETSLKQMVDRVSDTIAEWGLKDGYFGEDKTKDNTNFKQFLYKLKYYQINQFFAFNSPVYFNCGLSDKPQTSACFILDMDDTMESIYDSIKLESIIFKNGSGSGTNMSKLRSSKEKVRGGGFSSGPINFMRAADISAGVIRSGGTLRRSAKLVCLNDDHPNIIDFIHCKEKEEIKLRILKENGIKPDSGYEMSDHVFYQNTNISTRLSNNFMQAVERDDEWWTKFVLTNDKCEKFSARNLLREISEVAWKTGDPGVQFSDNINDWNTCADIGKIESSNPCSEYMNLPNTSCNLASINLLKFFGMVDGKIIFDYFAFADIINTVITAQDIIIHFSSYPSIKIGKNSNSLRPLGLGYSNLGGLLMWLGIPYDSEEGRNIAALLTSLMTGFAYMASNKLATVKDPFSRINDVQNSFYNVLIKHKNKNEVLLEHIVKSFNKYGNLINELMSYSKGMWDQIEDLAEIKSPFRNSQVTLLAPTGTISFLMDCATTGIEPGFSLISYKTLAGSGGAVLKLINPLVEQSLRNLGYNENEIITMLGELHSIEHFEDSTILKKEHLPIFDTASSSARGKRSINYMGHIKMLAATQPFLSGAISKTINLPNSSTVDDIYNIYLETWRMGLKCVTIYRDGSKTFQPLNVTQEDGKTIEIQPPHRKKLPPDRPGGVHKFSIGNIEGYMLMGHYEKDNSLGEIFLKVSKQGSTLSGLLDALALMISTNLQYGIPLKELVMKLMYLKFDPSGVTSNKNIRFTTSIVDYIAKYLGMRYLSEDDKLELGLVKEKKEESTQKIATSVVNVIKSKVEGFAPHCEICGSLMHRLGSCYHCPNCASNTGSCS